MIDKTYYERVGGEPTFRKLISEFYKGVATDPPLRDLYPEADLGPAEERLRMFMEQYWGGPGTYSEQRGHPRLRMRHVPFRIGLLERDAWLRCMHTAIAAIDSQTIDDAHRAALLEYLEMAADAMVNSSF